MAAAVPPRAGRGAGRGVSVPAPPATGSRAAPPTMRVKIAEPANKETSPVQNRSLGDETLAQSQNNLREYSLLIEYKHLQMHAPGGVYVMPQFDTLRIWHGIIFIRQGFYRQGVFKFVISIPEEYPEARPTVTFFSHVFHPLVHPETGELDLSVAFPTWRAGKDYVVLVLAFLKKIFYQKDLFTTRNAPNAHASELYQNNRKEFIEKVEACVRDSVSTVLENSPESSIKFAEFNSSHEKIREALLERQEPTEKEQKEGFFRWFTNVFVDQLSSASSAAVAAGTSASPGAAYPQNRK
eukprot:GILK01004782.1.p1 GENE.GILK01004782.1~~GILK01004782.1.p1  ORF type:complete len:296 (+),score=43.90 GILK01004782.1:85-972(+)